MEAKTLSNKQTVNREHEINFFELFGALLKRWWLILLAALLGALVMFVITRYHVTPLYRSSVSFYVNNGQRPEEKISTSDITASQSLVDTYIVILKYGTTLDDVIRDTKLDLTTVQLDKKIKCEAINETEVFQVTVTDPDPETAALIAQSIAKILPDKVADVIEGSTVRIVRNADVPTEPASPSVRKNTAIGAAVCFAVCCLVVALQYVLDDRIRDAAAMLKDHYSYPVLAVIPDLLGESNGHYYYYYHAKEK